MGYYFKTEKLLLEKFNIANKLNLKPEHVAFVNPRPADTVDITMSKVYNTAIDVVMKPSASYNGTVTIYYNRVNLLTEFSNAKLNITNYIYTHKEKTLHEAIGPINLKLGTHFDTDDIIDVKLSPKLLSTVRIQATANSMEYFGYIDVKLYRGSANKHVIDHGTSPIWHYEKERRKLISNVSPVNILQTTYNSDYTQVRTLLENLIVSESIPAWPEGLWGMDMANAFLNFMNTPTIMLNQVNPGKWSQVTGNADIIYMKNAVCIYRGTTADCVIRPYAVLSKHLNGIDKPLNYDLEITPANTRFKYVAVLLLDNPIANTITNKCLALLHYN